MQHIKVDFIEGSQDIQVEEIAELLNAKDKHKIDKLPWIAFKDKPTVTFAIAYNQDSILLKYFVVEKQIKAVYTAVNDPVFKDSCVEFFISLYGEKDYYNFEFNCIGNARCGYGSDKINRVFLPVSAIHKIKTHTKFGALSMNEDIAWELTIQIPFLTFTHHQLKSLTGEKCAVNFYKCGDDLLEPHYLCWNLIQSKDVNFHAPAFFGQLQFV